ncbi:hypothetical protein [Streptomyces sp. NPDC001642]|uniref:hypothetical protein n=1 Tax=Streptomyces sp. NPDC001642 TaxID=3154392 RepID=UPI003333A16F
MAGVGKSRLIQEVAGAVDASGRLPVVWAEPEGGPTGRPTDPLHAHLATLLRGARDMARTCRVRPESDPESDANPDRESHPESDANPDRESHAESYANPDRESHAESYANPDRESHPESYANPDRESHPGSHANPDRESHPGSDPNPDPESHPESDPNPEAALAPEAALDQLASAFGADDILLVVHGVTMSPAAETALRRLLARCRGLYVLCEAREGSTGDAGTDYPVFPLSVTDRPVGPTGRESVVNRSSALPCS